MRLLSLCMIATALGCADQDCSPPCASDELCSRGECWETCESDFDCGDSICVAGHCADGNRLPSIHCLPPYSGGIGSCPFGGPSPQSVPGVTIEDPSQIEALDLREQAEMAGDLVVSATYLSSLAGLECIVSVQGSVIVEQNLCLTSLDGLSGLETVVGSLTVDRNPVLGEVGLTSLTTVGGALVITNNESLSQAAAELAAEGVVASSKVLEGNGS